jgi:uncharacterized protein (DUF2147 family)
VVQLTLRERWPGVQNLYDDWANFAYYSIYLLAGYALACFPSLEDSLRREWRRALVLALGAMAVLLASVVGAVRAPALLLTATAVAGWYFVVALLGVARLRLTGGGRTLRYLAESAFPVYVLHQPAIVLLGFAVVQLPLGIAAKFALLLVAGPVLTLAVYELAVRPFVIPRRLLGMKVRAGLAVRPSARSVRAAALVVCLAAAAAPGAAATPVGLWWAEGGAAQVRIAPCGVALCGRVVWLRAPLDEVGCPVRDRNNPEPGRRDRPLIGLRVLRDLESSSEDGQVWTGGRIYDPSSGRTYRCTARLVGEDQLELHGFIGLPLIGRTTRWVRVGAERRTCDAASDEGAS